MSELGKQTRRLLSSVWVETPQLHGELTNDLKNQGITLGEHTHTHKHNTVYGNGLDLEYLTYSKEKNHSQVIQVKRRPPRWGSLLSSTQVIPTGYMQGHCNSGEKINYYPIGWEESHIASILPREDQQDACPDLIIMNRIEC